MFYVTITHARLVRQASTVEHQVCAERAPALEHMITQSLPNQTNELSVHKHTVTLTLSLSLSLASSSSSSQDQKTISGHTTPHTHTLSFTYVWLPHAECYHLKPTMLFLLFSADAGNAERFGDRSHIYSVDQIRKMLQFSIKTYSSTSQKKTFL